MCRCAIKVWFSNVPHARLAEDKGGQNWITIDKDKFKFPGGGTQFIHGADQYLDQIEKVFNRDHIYLSTIILTYINDLLIGFQNFLCLLDAT